MSIKKTLSRLLSLLILSAVLLSSLAFVPAAAAQADCGDTYTVVRGDTLREIARHCGTTVSALVRANPQIKNPNRIFPRQVLWLPGAIIPGDGDFDTYIVARGDTLRELAQRFGTTVNKLLKINPDIKNANVIFEGQRLLVSAVIIPDTGAGEIYVVQRGDTLRKIATRFDTTVAEILRLNPQIKDPNLIFPGQRITLPEVETFYVVQRGDTLRKIAVRFDTIVAELLRLNPKIDDPNLIFTGQVIRVR